MSAAALVVLPQLDKAPERGSSASFPALPQHSAVCWRGEVGSSVFHKLCDEVKSSSFLQGLMGADGLGIEATSNPSAGMIACWKSSWEVVQTQPGPGKSVLNPHPSVAPQSRTSISQRPTGSPADFSS